MKKLITIIAALALINLSANGQIMNNLFKAGNGFALNDHSRSPQSIIFKPNKEVDYHWDTVGNVWTFYDSIRNTYNASGNITLKRTYNIGAVMPNKTIYLYNANGKETSDTSSYWSGSAYVNNLIYTYMYDINNNQTQMKVQVWNGTNWYIAFQEDFTYTGNLLTESIMQVWNGTALVNSSKLDYTYSAGIATGGTTYKWNGTSWQNYRHIINVVWNQWNGSLLNSYEASDTQQVPNGTSWTDSIKTSYTYDAFYNTTDHLTQSKPSATYITTNDIQDAYLYDGNNNITQDIEQDWNHPTSAVRNKIKRVYSEYNQFTSGIDEINSDTIIAIYPNPFSSQTTLSFSQEQKNTTIKIMEILGKEIKTQTFSGKELIIEKGEMQAGIYIVQITDENKSIINKKIVIQ